MKKLNSTLLFIDEKLLSMRQKIRACESDARESCELGDKASAMHQLRLKAMYTRECGKISSLRFNIESNILHMESVGVMMETVSTIKDTSAQFKIISNHVDISKLENSIEEMFEQNDASSSIEDVLNELNSGIAIDDSDLKDEFDRMMMDLDGGGAPPASSLPVAPVFEPIAGRLVADRADDRIKNKKVSVAA